MKLEVWLGFAKHKQLPATMVTDFNSKLLFLNSSKHNPIGRVQVVLKKWINLVIMSMRALFTHELYITWQYPRFWEDDAFDTQLVLF